MSRVDMLHAFGQPGSDPIMLIDRVPFATTCRPTCLENIFFGQHPSLHLPPLVLEIDAIAIVTGLGKRVHLECLRGALTATNAAPLRVNSSQQTIVLIFPWAPQCTCTPRPRSVSHQRPRCDRARHCNLCEKRPQLAWLGPRGVRCQKDHVRPGVLCWRVRSIMAGRRFHHGPGSHSVSGQKIQL